MNYPEQVRHCGQRGCVCTHGAGMGDEATCDKGWVDGPRNSAGNETLAPCGTCYPAKAEAVALANYHGTSIHDALVDVARMAKASR